MILIFIDVYKIKFYWLIHYYYWFKKKIGTSDPYQRTRPKRCTSAGPHSKDSNDHNNDVDRCRSPITTDNVSIFFDYRINKKKNK